MKHFNTVSTTTLLLMIEHKISFKPSMIYLWLSYIQDKDQ